MAPNNPFTDGYWAVDTITGEIKHVSFLEWEVKYSLFTGVWLPFNTKAEAQNYLKKHPPKKKKSPADKVIGGIVDPTGSGGIGSIPGVGTLTDINGFVSALTQRNTWLRIGEGILGLLLIGIGVAALTKGTPIGAAIRTGVQATPAGKVTKVLK